MNKANPELIVMLTWHDYTVMDAAQVFEQCKDSSAKYWGFKEHPLPLQQMKKLYNHMHECGKTTFLEVVAYSEQEGLEGARVAAQCGCDVLMGTKFFDSINDYCHRHGIKYMPFVGEVTGRPSVLKGTINGMIAEALNKALVAALNAPVCLAGSIDSYARLNEVKAANPWAFTIGSAFFENKFDGTFAQQVDKVCNFMSM